MKHIKIGTDAQRTPQYMTAGRSLAEDPGPSGHGRTARERPASHTGLSTAHISPQEKPAFELITHLGGTYTKLKGTGQATGGGSRGCIGGFSRSSRQRLQRRMASINVAEVFPHRSFVTLTYPGQFPACRKEWKRHLDAFFKRLFRKYNVQAVVWKLEPQKRWAPHYHLIVITDDPLDREWTAQAWFEIVGSGRPEHLRAGTQCDPIRSWRGVLSYASKYLGKVEERSLPSYWRNPGRWWGVRGKLPIEAITQALTKEEGTKVRRVMRRFLQAKFGRKVKVFSAASGLAAYLPDEDAFQLIAWAIDEPARPARGTLSSKVPPGGVDTDEIR